MSFKTTVLAAFAAVTLALPAFAESIIDVQEPYAISSSPMATAGAAFMVVRNTGDQADRLISATSDAAALVQLHTHIIGDDGVARMVEVTEGWEIPPGGEVLLERGGNHVMFMGLTAPFEDGKMITVTLVFEKAGDVVVKVPVDLARVANPMGAMDHSTMDHGTMGTDTDSTSN